MISRLKGKSVIYKISHLQILVMISEVSAYGSRVECISRTFNFYELTRSLVRKVTAIYTILALREGCNTLVNGFHFARMKRCDIVEVTIR